MRTPARFVLFSLGLAAIGTMTFVAAQERQIGGGEGITVFDDRDFRGRSATFDQDVADLTRHGLNDRVTSLRIARGEQWEVCEHANYEGRCVVVSGEERDLRRNEWNHVISSFRRVRGGSAGPSTPPRDWYIVLYEEPRYRGDPKNFSEEASRLIGLRVKSVTIGRGVWELCEHWNFEGRCVTLDRSVPDLDRYGMRDRVASVRPVIRQRR
jgi:hypothetical protein